MRDLISVTPARVDMPTREPRMTAIVLTHRRESELARTLAQLAKLPEQPAIVVVDNASNDGTAAMVRRRFPRATLVRAPRNLGAAGRNLGAACARTPYIAFCDDDTWWESGSLTLAAQLFERHPRIGALTARVLVGIERREDPTCALMRASPLEHAPQQPGPTILGLLAGATAFRRGAFCAAGGYHPRLFVGGEETLLALDLTTAGWSLVYAPQLTIVHYPSPVRDARGRASVIARNAVWTAWLRLPAFAALLRTLRAAPRVWREAGGLRGWRRTLAGLPWTLRERRPIPTHVDAMRRVVEAADRLARRQARRQRP